MIKINLVPEELLARERQRQRIIQAVVIASVSVLVIVGVSAWHYRQLRKAETLLASTQKEYKDKWADIGSKLDKRKADVEALRTRLGVITDLLKGRALYPRFMADIGLTMPGDGWLTALNTSRDATKNQLKLTAMAVTGSAPSISKWLRTLGQPAAFGQFGDPTVSAISAQDDPNTGGKLYSFSLTMTYTPRP